MRFEDERGIPRGRRFGEIEGEIRRRFQAAATGELVYREVPTVGSDRDILSFFLEWRDDTGQSGAIAVHVDHLHSRLVCWPDPIQADLTDPALPWLDVVLALVPISPGGRE